MELFILLLFVYLYFKSPEEREFTTSGLSIEDLYEAQNYEVGGNIALNKESDAFMEIVKELGLC